MTLTLCPTCLGRGWCSVGDEDYARDHEQCGDCGGTGFDTDIPAAVLFEEEPEWIEQWMEAEVLEK